MKTINFIFFFFINLNCSSQEQILKDVIILPEFLDMGETILEGKGTETKKYIIKLINKSKEPLLIVHAIWPNDWCPVNAPREPILYNDTGKIELYCKNFGGYPWKRKNHMSIQTNRGVLNYEFVYNFIDPFQLDQKEIFYSIEGTNKTEIFYNIAIQNSSSKSSKIKITNYPKEKLELVSSEIIDLKPNTSHIIRFKVLTNYSCHNYSYPYHTIELEANVENQNFTNQVFLISDYGAYSDYSTVKIKNLLNTDFKISPNIEFPNVDIKKSDSTLFCNIGLVKHYSSFTKDTVLKNHFNEATKKVNKYLKLDPENLDIFINRENGVFHLTFFAVNISNDSIFLKDIKGNYSNDYRIVKYSMNGFTKKDQHVRIASIFNISDLQDSEIDNYTMEFKVVIHSKEETIQIKLSKFMNKIAEYIHKDWYHNSKWISK